ncbi:MAG: thiamine phosphate synthase [Synergistaceae bacterium]|jgi:thiamine-phosphate pyrophosphorylase|nr:thiamine phosphate synthase [Synergistaceae bacterium]
MTTMKPEIDYTLYLVTDRELMSSASVGESVRQAIAGGCTVVQLREKSCSSRKFYETAHSIREITSRLGVPLIINDRPDIALAADADGVHVGQDDLPCGAVRRIVGNDKIIGVSVSNLREALAARDAGADYLGVGAMYATGAKPDAGIAGMEDLRMIRAAIALPIVVIGGINADTVPNFKDTGIDGIAAVSAIVASGDVAGAARKLKKIFAEFRR